MLLRGLLGSPGWHGIGATTAPGMTATDAFDRQPAAARHAVNSDRFERILRAARLETAPATWAKQRALHRRKHPTIKPNPEHQNVLTCVHPDPYLKSLAFRRVVKKSFSTSANIFPAMEGRATRTRSTS